MGHVFEWHGYRGADTSPAAAHAAHTLDCPFVPGGCDKKDRNRIVTGACAVVGGAEANPPVIVCPKRLYFDGFSILREIAHRAFAPHAPATDATGVPTLVSGVQARARANASGHSQVGVFGKHWGPDSGEVPLPAVGGRSSYSVDYTLVCVSPAGHLLDFAAIEVQTIDTTGSYQVSLAGLRAGRQLVRSVKMSMNWENVNKRIIPQLIYKGTLLQGEAKCSTGLYFVTPQPVYARVMQRLTGGRTLRAIPPRADAITFVPYDFAPAPYPEGAPVPLILQPGQTISTSDMAQAFITPQNLPTPGTYATAIETRL